MVDILFGIPSYTSSVVFNLNVIIMYGKWYIYRMQLDSKDLFMYNFLCELKSKVQVEHYLESISINFEKQDNKWRLLLLNL